MDIDEETSDEYRFEELPIMEKMKVIEQDAKNLKKLVAELYMNDEGEDVRDLAAKAEAQRDALREVELERNADHARDNEI